MLRHAAPIIFYVAAFGLMLLTLAMVLAQRWPAPMLVAGVVGCVVFVTAGVVCDRLGKT